jgi:hypothetical protein
MDDMEVLTPSFAHNARITFEDVEIVCDVPPQLFEDRCASGEVQRRKIRVRDGLSDDLRRRSRNKLDNPGRYAGFCEDLVDEIVGICCRW